MRITQYIHTTLTIAVLAIAACSSGQSPEQKTTDTATVVVQESQQKVPEAKVSQLAVDKLRILREAGTDIVLLDVRTPEEVGDGKIAGAIEIDYQGENFEKQIDALGREKSYVVYCAAGGRSQKAAEMMVQKGFRNVFNLKGGYDAWKSHSGD